MPFRGRFRFSFRILFVDWRVLEQILRDWPELLLLLCGSRLFIFVWFLGCEYSTFVMMSESDKKTTFSVESSGNPAADGDQGVVPGQPRHRETGGNGVSERNKDQGGLISEGGRKGKTGPGEEAAAEQSARGIEKGDETECDRFVKISKGVVKQDDVSSDSDIHGSTDGVGRDSGIQSAGTESADEDLVQMKYKEMVLDFEAEEARQEVQAQRTLAAVYTSNGANANLSDDSDQALAHSELGVTDMENTEARVLSKCKAELSKDAERTQGMFETIITQLQAGNRRADETLNRLSSVEEAIEDGNRGRAMLLERLKDLEERVQIGEREVLARRNENVVASAQVVEVAERKMPVREVDSESEYEDGVAESKSVPPPNGERVFREEEAARREKIIENIKKQQSKQQQRESEDVQWASVRYEDDGEVVTMFPAEPTMAEYRRAGVQGAIISKTFHEQFEVKATKPIPEGRMLDDLVLRPWRDGESLLCCSFKGRGGVMLDGQGECFLKYCNHSCNPNCKLVRVTDENGMQQSVWLVSVREIAVQERLTVDYGWTVPDGEERTPCMCGEMGCREYIQQYEGSVSSSSESDEWGWEKQAEVLAALQQCDDDSGGSQAKEGVGQEGGSDEEEVREERRTASSRSGSDEVDLGPALKAAAFSRRVGGQGRSSRASKKKEKKKERLGWVQQQQLQQQLQQKQQQPRVQPICPD